MDKEQWVKENKERVQKKYRQGVEKVFEWMRELGGVVSDDWEAARAAECDGCEYNGEVEPLPGIIVPGCTHCGCPFETKRTMRSVFGILKIKCTHPHGNKWSQIDKFYFNNGKN